MVSRQQCYIYIELTENHILLYASVDDSVDKSTKAPHNMRTELCGIMAFAHTHGRLEE